MRLCSALGMRLCSALGMRLRSALGMRLVLCPGNETMLCPGNETVICPGNETSALGPAALTLHISEISPWVGLLPDALSFAGTAHTGRLSSSCHHLQRVYCTPSTKCPLCADRSSYQLSAWATQSTSPARGRVQRRTPESSRKLLHCHRIEIP